MTQKPVLHGDNGSTLKATTVLAMMYRLGLKASYSRPQVSDDSAFGESLFRTRRVSPRLPGEGLCKSAGRAPVGDFVRALVQHRSPP